MQDSAALLFLQAPRFGAANLPRTLGCRFAHMKPVEEIRRANLLLLIQEAGNMARLSELTMVPAPYISQVSRGVMNSKGKGARLMGPDVARRMEAKMGKPRGWMDTDHSAISLAADLNGREGQLIGLFRLMTDAQQVEHVNELTKKLRERRPPDAGDATGPAAGLQH